MKNYLKYLAIPAFIGFLGGCGESKLEERVIQNNTFSLYKNKIVQETKSPNKGMSKIGLVYTEGLSDENIQRSLDAFKDKGLEAIMISGNNLEPYAKLRIPVFAISKSEDLEKLKNKYSNIFDLTEKYADLIGLNILNKYEEKIVKKLKEQNDFTVLISDKPEKGRNLITTSFMKNQVKEPYSILFLSVFYEIYSPIIIKDDLPSLEKETQNYLKELSKD